MKKFQKIIIFLFILLGLGINQTFSATDTGINVRNGSMVICGHYLFGLNISVSPYNVIAYDLDNSYSATDLGHGNWNQGIGSCQNGFFIVGNSKINANDLTISYVGGMATIPVYDYGGYHSGCFNLDNTFFYSSNASNNAYEYNISTGTSSLLNSSTEINSCVMGPDGNLYGQIYNDLYKLDLSTNTGTLLATLLGISVLNQVASTNKLYYTNYDIYKMDYDGTNNELVYDGATNIYSFGFYNGNLYYADNAYNVYTTATTEVITPPVTDLQITGTGTLSIQNQSIILTDFETNKDYYMSYIVSNVTNGEEFYFINNDETAFYGGLNDLTFSDVGLVYNNLVDYEIEVILTAQDNPSDVILYNFDFTYSYNSGYTEPVEADFTFNSGWYSWGTTGFVFNNFIPSPYGGDLYFEIIGPALTGTGTINIETQKYGPIQEDPNGYGFDTMVKVTYPYHEVPGIYQVRALYDYKNVTVYPYGTDYQSYEVTVAMVPPVDYVQEDIEVNYFGNIIDFFVGIKDLFKELMKIGNVEPRNFGFNFIGQANAASTDVLYIEMDMTQDNILTQFYGYIKGFIMFALLIILITILIIILRKE